MAEDLVEFKERLSFCDAENRELHNKIKEYIETLVEIRKALVPEGMAIQIRTTADPPASFTSKAGMIIHEARSCLDGLACALADRHSGSHSGTYFPISRSKAIFEDDGLRKIRKLSDGDKQKIINIAPYKGGNNFLFGMHEFDRTRKHIRLLPVFTTAGRMSMSVMSNDFHLVSMGGVGKITSEWQNVAVMGFGQAKIDVEIQLDVDGVAELKGIDVVQAAKRFIEECQEIVQLFS